MKRSLGSEMIQELSQQLNIGHDDDSTILQCGENVKKFKTSNIQESRSFNPKKDTFKMTTFMGKLISQITDCIKGDVTAQLKFDQNGINIFSFHHSKTVCFNTRLGRDLFSSFECDIEVFASINLKVLAEKMAILQKLKRTLTFENDDGDLVLTGYIDGQPPAKIKLKPLHTESAEELDLDGYTYNVPVRIRSDEFSKLIDCMPQTFSIRMDCEHGELVFLGNEDHSTTRLPMKLEQDVVDKIKKYPEIKNYNATFAKANLGGILKGAKLSEYVIVAFQDDPDRHLPLFVRYILNESADHNPDNNSQISMYFCPKIEDDMDDEL